MRNADFLTEDDGGREASNLSEYWLPDLNGKVTSWRRMACSPQPWVIAVVDDDRIIQKVTQSVLAEFTFEGRGTEILAARSAAEAMEFFRNRRDIAVAIVDVMMETETAGLELVKFIRTEAKNPLTRIVLRTGIPDLAPESSVIRDYDLHDYWEKNELSTRKLSTVVHSALRAYRDLLALEMSRRSVSRLLDMLPSLQLCQNRGTFIRTAFAQIRTFLDAPGVRGFVGEIHSERITLLYTERTSWEVGDSISAQQPESHHLALLAQDGVLAGNGHLSFCLQACHAVPLVFYLEGCWLLSDEDIRLLGLVRHQMEMQLENLCLWSDTLDSQLETIHLLADAVETRSKETGAHTHRVGEMSRILAKELGLDERRCEQIHRAAPLHDLGKIAIPDAILNKPGKLSPEEWEIMTVHAQVGYDILARSPRGPLQLAAVIARDHHEKWNGKGYPHRLRGEEISLEGRIVAIADVVDALQSRRCYKEPWPVDRVLALIREERGQQFDPQVVDAFFRCQDEILDLRRTWPDPEDD